MSKYNKNIITENTSGFKTFAEFKNAMGDSRFRYPNGEPKAFIYHCTTKPALDNFKKTGSIGCKEFFGPGMNNFGLYAVTGVDHNNYATPYKGNDVIKFYLKNGFSKILIFRHDHYMKLIKLGLISKYENTYEQIKRIFPEGDYKKEFLSRLSGNHNLISEYEYLNIASSILGKHFGSNDLEAYTKGGVEGIIPDRGMTSDTIVIKIPDAVIPFQYDKRWMAKDWVPFITNDATFDKFNNYVDALGRFGDKYPETDYAAQPIANTILLIGPNKEYYNYVNTLTEKIVLPFDVSSASPMGNNGEAMIKIGGDSWVLKTDGKNYQFLNSNDNQSVVETNNGFNVFKGPEGKMLFSHPYEEIQIESIPTKHGSVSTYIVKKPDGYNIILNPSQGELFPFSLKSIEKNPNQDNAFNFTTYEIKKLFFLLPTKSLPIAFNNKGQLQKCSLDDLINLVNSRRGQGMGNLNESYTDKSRTEFMNDIHNGNYVKVYTCCWHSAIPSIFEKGMSHEFIGGGDDSSLYYGIGAYCCYSQSGAIGNVGPTYGDTVLELSLKDGFKDFIVFDDKMIEKLHLPGPWDQMKPLLSPKGREIMEKIKYQFYKGAYGGEQAKTFFERLKGDFLFYLFPHSWSEKHHCYRDKGPLYTEKLIAESKVRGYIFDGRNNHKTIVVRDFNSLIPIRCSRKFANNSVIPNSWEYNENLNTDEGFDKLNNNVFPWYQYRKEYNNVAYNLKPKYGYVNVSGEQGDNYMNIRTHNPLLFCDVTNTGMINNNGASEFIDQNENKWYVRFDTQMKERPTIQKTGISHGPELEVCKNGNYNFLTEPYGEPLFPVDIVDIRENEKYPNALDIKFENSDRFITAVISQKKNTYKFYDRDNKYAPISSDEIFKQ